MSGLYGNALTEAILKVLPRGIAKPEWCSCVGSSEEDSPEHFHRTYARFVNRRRRRNDPEPPLISREWSMGDTGSAAVAFALWRWLIARPRIDKDVRRRACAALFEAAWATEKNGACRSCGRVVPIDHIGQAPDLCFECQHWLRLAEPEIRDAPTTVRMEGRHMKIHPDNKEHLGSMGFGGAEWWFRFHDGRVVRSRNVWSQGVIPARFRDLLPDNAVTERPTMPGPGDAYIGA